MIKRPHGHLNHFDALSVDDGYTQNNLSALLSNGNHNANKNQPPKKRPLMERLLQKRNESNNESLTDRNKLEKKMFTNIEDNKDDKQKHVLDDEPQYINVNLNGDLHEKLIVDKKQRLLHQSSFYIEDQERQCLQLSERGNLWIILALLAGICYAFNNFFLGQLAHHGLVAVIYVNIPSFFLFMIVYAVNLIRNKYMYGFFWCREVSIFFKKEDNSVDWFCILGAFLMSFCKFCGFCLVVLTFHYANAAGMNLGIITVIFNFCCITDSVVFYFVFNEKLSRSQLIGSGVLLLSAFFIAQKPHPQSESAINSYGRYPGETEKVYLDRIEKIEQDHYQNSMLAIGTALACTLFFSARDVILRYFKVNKHYPAFELSLDSLTIYSFGCTLYALYIFNFQDYHFDWSSFYAGCMSAVLNTFGFMMLGISVVIGYAGPANALNSIQAVVLTFLGITMMNQIPTHMQITGMLLGMCGTIIVSVGDAIVSAFNSCLSHIKRARDHLSQEEGEDTAGDGYVRIKD